MNYLEAKKLFKTCKNNESGKPLENNTRLMQRGDNFAVKLHDTDIVTITPNDTFILNTGGWFTLTTKDRINKYNPIRVYQSNKLWYLGDYDNEQKVLFFDGIEVDLNGRVLNPKSDKENTKSKQKAKHITEYINNYIKGFVESIEKNGIDDPNYGDCWYCSMVTAEGKPLGDCVSESDHLISHFKEKYYVPSLLLNAIKESGYTNIPIIWHMIKDNKDIYHAKNALRKYFKKRFHKLCELK